MDTRSPSGTPPRAGRREWIGLAVLALPTLLLALDLSVLYLALPSIGADLGASSTQLLWITDVYGFMTAGFLVTMGTLGDRIGRRKLLLFGAAAFGVASAVAAFSTSPGMLIGARAAMGVAGATLMPSTLALISNMFRDPKQRGMAIGVWMSCFMGGAAAGPVIGGALLERFWWGSVLLVGVPVMVLLLVAAPLMLPEYRGGGGRLDPVSVAVSLAALLPVIYGMKELARGGSWLVPGLLIVVGVAFGVIFVRRQRRLESPLLDVRLFGNLAFSSSLVTLMFGVATQGGIMLLVTQYLQSVEGLSPLRAGLWLVPSSLAMVAGSLLAPSLAQRSSPRLVIAGGMALASAGFLVLALLDISDGLAMLVAGIVPVFLGVGLMGAVCQDLIVGTVRPEKAGSAASLSQTSGDFGIAFGVATLGSVGAAVYGSRMSGLDLSGVPAGAREASRETIGEALAAAARLDGPVATGLIADAREAFTAGLNIAAAASAVLVAALAVLAYTALRPPVPSDPVASEGEAVATERSVADSG
ncbi:MFS transporter [Streptomyces griseus]|uniref:MFS transporter n=1 Tax=Streptomyces griseus TaxID=1911 RepID=UPI0038308936